VKDFKLTAEFIKRKAKATKILHSKELNKLRTEAINKGALPYKILKYKRIVSPEKTPMPLSNSAYVRPDNFEKQIKYLVKEANLIPLSHLVELIEANKKIPERTVAITIDYGHMDSYLYAFPVLLKNQVHATFFISSGYIENNTYLFNDRLVLVLMGIANKKMLLPEFHFLPEDIREEATRISPHGKITEEFINFLTQQMSFATSKERLTLMAAIADFKDTPKLLEFEDFMRWEDLKHLQDTGYSLCNMGHFSISNTDIALENFKYDVGYSINEYKKNNIKIDHTFCIPDMSITENRYQGLSELGCRYLVNELFYPEPRFQTKLPMILSRKTINEANSSSIEFFACHLWDIEL